MNETGPANNENPDQGVSKNSRQVLAFLGAALIVAGLYMGYTVSDIAINGVAAEATIVDVTPRRKGSTQIFYTFNDAQGMAHQGHATAMFLVPKVGEHSQIKYLPSGRSSRLRFFDDIYFPIILFAIGCFLFFASRHIKRLASGRMSLLDPASYR